MIKINLIPVKRRKKPKPVPTFVIVGTFLLLFALIAGFYGKYYLDDEMEALQARKTENIEKLAKLNDKIKEVKDFESLNKVFTERKDIIEHLSKAQSTPAKLLDELSMRLSDGVWLNSMDITTEQIKITGVGFSPTDIVNYVQSLKGSGLLSDVVLVETSASKLGEIDVFNFSISMGWKV
jgi:type IV pilus assembly protein PilN